MTSIAYDTPIRTGAQNLDKVLSAGRPAMLVFETPDCQACQTLEPALNELARQRAGQVLVVRVEQSAGSGLPGKFRLRQAPTLVFWRDGREVARLEGAVDMAALRSNVDFYLLGQGNRPKPASGPAQPLKGPAAPNPVSNSAGRAEAPQPASETAEHPQDVTDVSFARDVMASDLPVLVDFWAPWCGPCRMVSPAVEALGREYAGRMRVVKMNTDENPRVPSSLGIQGIPTLIFFKNGKEVDRIVGAAPKPMIQARVEKALRK